ncbi:MAG: 1-acyl-sn-glycerol-3-phosphate acyltransferase [Myxococcales bacterium]|nr:1-acyl-sn-glycerol-3-phosphate acyltransferase [Myxococcales bacterium]
MESSDLGAKNVRPTPAPADFRAAVRAARFGALASVELARYELSLRRHAPEARRALLRDARRRVATRLLTTLGVKVDGEGGDETPRARLIVANHRAALDIGVLLTRVDAVFLSRADLAEWPLLGRMARHAGTVFVDRASQASGANAIRAIRRRLAEGDSVVVFPEGSTFAGDAVQPFKPGAFAAARGLDVDIVPVGLAYPSGVEYVGVDFVTHLRTVAARRTTPVGLVVGEPFRAEGRTAALAERAEHEVRELVVRARRRLAPIE